MILAEDIQIVALRCGALGRKTPLSFSGGVVLAEDDVEIVALRTQLF